MKDGTFLRGAAFGVFILITVVQIVDGNNVWVLSAFAAALWFMVQLAYDIKDKS